jgi:hypothetical protein
MLKRYLITSAIILLFIISSIGFVTAKSAPKEEAVYVANFNYTPYSQAAPGSAGVTFTIGKPSYTPDKNDLFHSVNVFWFTLPQFNNLYKAIQQSLSDLLLAKGFAVRGPFGSYDLIPYQDKKDIDLYLVPNMQLSVYMRPETEESGFGGNTPTAHIVKLYLVTNLELREIVTNELMWHKSFPTEFALPGYKNSISLKATKTHNDVAKAMEQHYPEVMATIAKLIDPEEMKIIKKQCQELKSKKGY